MRRVVRQREEQLPLRPPGSEEVSATILAKMKKPAETYLGRKVNDALVAVPAYSVTPSVRPPRRRNHAGFNMMRSPTSSQQLQLHMAWKRGQ